jgi:DNA-binding transcriptional MerR regulator
MEKSLPAIPAKRYFTIGEVSELCAVKPHVLRYWEQEFTQLKPMKRRGNRRYYQHHEVLMIRRIRDLLYDQGFTISGARNKMQEVVQAERDKRQSGEVMLAGIEPEAMLLDSDADGEPDGGFDDFSDSEVDQQLGGIVLSVASLLTVESWQSVRNELLDIRALLEGAPSAV